MIRLPKATFAALALTLFALLGTSAEALADNLPTVVTEPASDVGVTTVRLSGEVNPNGEAGSGNTGWKIQYRLSGGEAFLTANAGTIEPTASEEANPVAVEAVLGFGGELEPGKTYDFRILAENAAGTAKTQAPLPTFTMKPMVAATLSIGAPDEVGRTVATLHGEVDPQGGNENPYGPEVLPLEWQMQYSLEDGSGQPAGWNVGTSGRLEGADALAPASLNPQFAPGTLTPGKSYLIRLVIHYGNEFFPREASTPEPFESIATDPGTPPSIAAPQVEAVTTTSATFKAAVDPNAPDETANLSDDDKAAFRSSWHFECVAPGAPCAQPSGDPVEADNAAHAVEVNPTNLQAHTHYVVKLVAENAAGRVESAANEYAEFTTSALAPTLGADVATPEGPGAVKIRGFVNPHNSTVTDCHFEYGATESYGATAACESDPNGPGAQEATAKLTGLTPGATYHYRLVVDNGTGPAVEGPDGTFAVFSEPSEEGCPNAGAPGTNFLPECRAYEMVSPPGKNGNDVLADTQRIRAADDGSAIQFPSQGAFGDAIGIGVAADYIAEREGTAGTNGWATHAITPPQDPLGTGAVQVTDPLYVGDFSADLSRGVFRAWSPLTNDPNVAKSANLYLRDDLRSPGAGHYRLLSACPLCEESGQPLPDFELFGQTPWLVGASADFSKVVFQSIENLTPDSASLPFGPRAYEWDEGELSLVNQIPPGSQSTCSGDECVPAEVSGPGEVGSLFVQPGRQVNVISDDGSRLFFSVPSSHFFGGAGNVYMRSGQTTTLINASEREDCSGSACEFSPANYLSASADGSRVFFTTTQPLTDDAPADHPGDGKLYMYDAGKPASDPHNLTLINVDHEPADVFREFRVLLGIGGQGSYAYFVQNGQLVPGAPVLGGESGLYAWHEGHVSYIGRINIDGLAEVGESGGNVVTPVQGRVSADGRQLLFPVHDGSGFALGYDHGPCQGNYGHGCREFYLYNADTGELSCASCNPDGTAAKSDAAIGLAEIAVSATTWHTNRAIGADGRLVFFSSEEDLLPEDTNDKSDAYEYDTQTGALHLLSSGTSPANSYFVEIGADGKDAFILTRERLSGWDKDTSLDLYDVRVDGGFPEPPAETAPCSGDSCRPPGPPPPNPAPNSSATLVAPQNPVPARCPKGKHRVKARGGKSRCVKPKKHKQAKKRHANSNRGAER